MRSGPGGRTRAEPGPERWRALTGAGQVAIGSTRDGEAARAQLERWRAGEAPYLAEQRTRERADVVVRT